MKKNNGEIAFITNICGHYTVKLFELLSEKYNIHFYFTGGDESYRDKNNQLFMGNFKGEYLKGFTILPKFKISPKLFTLFSSNTGVFIKTVDDRFATILAFCIAKLRRKPFVLWTGLWSHPQTMIHRMTFMVTKFIYRHADAIIVYGDHVKKYLIDLGIPEQKIFCAPHSIDNKDFNKHVSDAERLEIKTKLGVTHGKILLYVGRIESCKGLDYLMDALVEWKEYPLNVLLIGSGMEVDKFKKRCSDLPVKCIFLDHIKNEELYRYYAVADMLVLPSITTERFKEPWGLVVNEAMNQGCPIIATNAVGSAMGGLVDDKQNGFIVPEKNSTELRKVIEALVKDDQLSDQMSRSARDKIEEWTPAKTSDGFAHAIDSVLHGS